MSQTLQAKLASGPSWSCCQRCQQRTACPFAMDQLIRQTAQQGYAAAKAISLEACKQKAAARNTTSVEMLLAQDHALFCTMAQIMRQELESMDPLFTREIS